MINWKCSSCHKAIRVSAEPHYCQFCGAMASEKSKKHKRMGQYISEINNINESLNKLDEQMKPLKERRNFIMNYFRNALTRGALTREEYDKIVQQRKKSGVLRKSTSK